MPNTTRLNIDVTVRRAGRAESWHHVHAAVVRADGTLVASAGDADLVTFWRSCAKPIQVLPLLRAGGIERFGWGDEEIALACASHGGEPEHVTVAARMLSAIGLEEGDLACGPQEPLARRGAQLARDARVPFSRLHNNCSGKHAAMLARAVAADWRRIGYEGAEHPVQREALAEVATWTGVPASDIGVGVDGCGVCVFALPLRAMALAYARFAAAADAGIDPPARILAAIRAAPFMFGGTERFDTVIAEETQGAVIAKAGAEGVHGVMVPGLGLGAAVKVADGATRAQHAAVLALLQHLGALPDVLPQRLEAFAHRAVKNTRGDVVGDIAIGDDWRVGGAPADAS